MNAFLSACAAVLLLSIVAWGGLDSLGLTSEASNTADRGSVRLN